jgi:hypothetical protein
VSRPSPPRSQGERKVKVYDTEDLLQMFECADVAMLLAKPDVIGVIPYVTRGPGGSFVGICFELPVAGYSALARLRQQVIYVAHGVGV